MDTYEQPTPYGVIAIGKRPYDFIKMMIEKLKATN